MNQRLTNLLASAGVALVVSTAVSGASPTPSTHHVTPFAAASAPSTADKLAALTKRVNTLQKRVADDHKHLRETAIAAFSASSVTDCIVGGVWLVIDDDGFVISDDGATGDAFVTPTFDPECTEEAPA